MDETKVKIRAFLARHFRNVDLQDDQDIFTLGFVSSLFALQLIAFVEQEFNITIENEDLEFDNFRTINAVSGLIERKSAAISQS